jgi:SAM-dependent methyltransferase
MQTKDSLIRKLYRTRLVSETIYSHLFLHLFFLKKELEPLFSVLDIGCGDNSPLRYCKVARSVGVDIFEPAVQESRKRGIHDNYIIADAAKLEFKDRSFDVVVLFEVLEHLNKEEGRMLLEKAEKWAVKKVIISCPNGYSSQPERYGNPYQAHRCGWDIEEITTHGYLPYGMVGLRWKPGRFLFFPLAFWVFWVVISVALQKLTYRHPKLAFEICYVKNLA